ncbi:phosphoglucosamine mutase [Rickettsiella endosymbiont of Dermanyssus gallinae]|uniref:phosphoglucosamine mutase n=1 Tax=Rickettsiella endosymbiont of Dermanyssus gallinae TaxID=2856608 RepID=UPI001C52AADD|nr:phosphoglucosamine mutase [Rickettsiella endosymbiont of Dermanyssus gallinae]
MTSPARKYFGTDGIRGKVGDYPITPEFVLKLGWAIGRVLANGDNKILIGKDTRISGYMFESALEAGLSAAGADIYLLGPMPTPAIAYLTADLGAQAGIVISASHNPYDDNGIKFFSYAGTKLPDSIECAIEAQLDNPLTTVEPAKLGRAHRIEDAKSRYVNFCKSTLPKNTRFNSFKIVLDCANGATYHIAPALFSELGADITVLGVTPNGLNINMDCGSTHLGMLQKTVLEKKADIGIAFDGDGDRVLMVDHCGEIVDGDELLFLLAQHGVHSNTVQGGIVGTAMSNLGLEQALQKLGLAFVRAPVGDRYVNEHLQATGWQLGGEASGHIISRNLIKTGDGIIIALQILVALQAAKQSLHAAKKGMQKFPQKLINIPVKKPLLTAESATVKKAVAEAENKLSTRGRVLLRPSGTEPVVRIMVEGEDAQQVQGIAEQLAEIVKTA